MKKIIALSLALTFVLSTAGCGNSKEDEALERAASVSAIEETDFIVKSTETATTTARDTQPITSNLTTTTNVPMQNSTQMVNKIAIDAKAKSETATPEELQKALDNLRALSGNFYASNDTMHSVMYNSQLLYYYYKDTNTPYEQAGFYAFTAVKYVYRGIDTVDSKDTSDSLTKFASALLQCDDIVSTTTTMVTTQNATEAPTEPLTESNIKKIYNSGVYKVGVDIPAGEYCVYAEYDDYGGYYCVSSDSAGDSIIGNDNFDYNAFVTVYDGQYIKLSRAIAIPANEIDGVKYKIDTSKTGTFRVGIDIPAGEYKLINNSDYFGYYCVYNSSDADADIVTNDNFEGQAYITVYEGQYLLINRCNIMQ